MGFIHEIGYAKFDPSVSRGRLANSEHVPSWESVYIRLLQRSENEAAELVKKTVEEAREIDPLVATMKKTEHLEVFDREAA